jgi:formylglycine-generating enzyme required for sulfatase activity
MDMAANIYEMTTGYWGESGRAMRGGSYLNAGAYTRTMFRWAPEDDSGTPWLGFRCVMDSTMIQTMAIPMSDQ